MECTNYVPSRQSQPRYQGNGEVETVSETEWIEDGKVYFTTGETVLYSGLGDDNAPHEKVVALILSKETGRDQSLSELFLLGVSRS